MLLTGWVVATLTAAAFKCAAEIALARLNLAELWKWRDGPPAELTCFTTPERFKASSAYVGEKLRFGMLEELWSFVVIAVVLVSGVGPLTHSWIAASGSVWAESLWLVLLLTGISSASLPLDAYDTFSIEQRHGFNKSTASLWISDKLKGGLIGMILGGVLLCLLLFLVRQAGLYWWIYGLFVFVGWQMLMIVAYPKFILPLFNKLTPLEEGELRDRLSALGERAGFPVCRIEVIDGSRRSGHSNAFFTGFGKARRIVLYDTLIRQLSTCELEAVLAHEIGHYRKGHIPRMIGLSALLAGVCFAAIAWIDRSPAILEAFGFAAGSGSAPAFFIALLLAGPVGFCLSPLLHALSRRHEYEADAYARELTGGHQSLESALLKLQTENLSNLVPHPLYSAIHYSHPALRERLAALRGGSGGTTCTPSA